VSNQGIDDRSNDGFRTERAGPTFKDKNRGRLCKRGKNASTKERKKRHGGRGESGTGGPRERQELERKQDAF